MSAFRFDDLARKLLLLNHDEFTVFALEELVTARMSEAWDEGHRLTAPHSDRCEPRCRNPYAAPT